MMLQEYEENYQFLQAQTQEYENTLAQFEDEIHALEKLLHANVNAVIADLKGTYTELINNKVKQVDGLNKQLQSLRDALQTCHALRGLMEDFQVHANPTQLIQVDEDDDGEEDMITIVQSGAEEEANQVQDNTMEYRTISPSHQQNRLAM
jgi:prefoldin subunit 5